MGTDYLAHVMHKNNADRNMHEEMGFHDGWGTVDRATRQARRAAVVTREPANAQDRVSDDDDAQWPAR